MTAITKGESSVETVFVYIHSFS